MTLIAKHCAILLTFFILVSWFNQSKSVNVCEDWTSYKDEKCFKVIEDATKTYDEAEKSCAQLENSPTLALIHSQEEQDFLVNYLFRTLKKVDNFWIGAKFSNNALHWIDNSSLTFTNWDTKGAHNKPNYCVQILAEEATLGKWIDEPCERKNAFVCQKMQTWTLARLQEAFLESRKQFTDALDVANKKIAEQKHEIEVANKQIIGQKRELEEVNAKIIDQNHNIVNLKQNQIPIGFIYTQLPNEKPPTSIWPSLNWTDISSAYSGVFFRVNGGKSELFGQTQAENAPRLIKVERTTAPSEGEDYQFDTSTFSESTRTSSWLHTGDFSVSNHIFYRFTISGGEVRPRNMAIRVWKRTD